jgi:hypothetical protein
VRVPWPCRECAEPLGYAAALSSLFGFLYVLLSLETYSLLVGSIALFLVLSVVMAVTQCVDRRGMNVKSVCKRMSRVALSAVRGSGAMAGQRWEFGGSTSSAGSTLGHRRARRGR